MDRATMMFGEEYCCFGGFKVVATLCSRSRVSFPCCGTSNILTSKQF